MSEAIALDATRGLVSEAEWAVRVDLAMAYRLVAHYGWDDMIFTHLSARVPGPDDHFLINPFGMLFGEVTASSLVKIDTDGNVVLDNGYRVNTAGFTIHSAVHMAREDAGAVMHLHTQDGVAVSSMECGFLPLNQHAMFVHDDVVYHDWEGVAVDLDERERLTADLGTHNLMILRNHGTLAVGSTVAACFLRLYYLEKACAIQVRTLPGGVNTINPAAAGNMTAMLGQPGAWEGLGAQAWPGLQRLADRNFPDYTR